MVTTTTYYGEDVSWTIHTCSSNKTYLSHKDASEKCCLNEGQYQLICKDLYGNGWDGAYLTFLGKRYCEDFTDGNLLTKNITILRLDGK